MLLNSYAQFTVSNSPLKNASQRGCDSSMIEDFPPGQAAAERCPSFVRPAFEK
jgi:hypothetical protein